MKTLYENSTKLIELTQTKKVRSHIKWFLQNERLIGIKGSRGVGKTTLLLQYAKLYLQKEKYIYLSLDDLYFSENHLSDFVDDFSKNGGTVLLLDEVHHYPSWSREIKNIYDKYPNLKIVYTGSSLLHLNKGNVDLSRRSVTYTLPGLSLREYINFKENIDLPVFSLDQIIKDHINISKEIWTKIKPILHYNLYVKEGIYPFFLEGTENYHKKLNAIILHVLESDLPFTAGINYYNISKLKQLLYIISESVPFKPNIEKLSERTGLARNTLKEYLLYLESALLVNLLRTNKIGISKLSKPEKIYLHNSNIMYALAGDSINIGTVRETFFINQLSAVTKVEYSKESDFHINGKYIFEIGGKNKTNKQIRNLQDAYLAMDGIETGFRNEIPLWLFGFLY